MAGKIAIRGDPKSFWEVGVSLDGLVQKPELDMAIVLDTHHLSATSLEGTW